MTLALLYRDAPSCAGKEGVGSGMSTLTEAVSMIRENYYRKGRDKRERNLEKKPKAAARINSTAIRRNSTGQGLAQPI